MPAPALGPDSLTWRYFGDARGMLFAIRAGVLQAMHPAIDAALRQHSDFFENPWNRLLRSAPPILGVVYDGPRAEDTGTWVRDQHRSIKGVDANGARYHALDPDAFYWAHATFFESMIAVQTHLGNPLSRLDQERLYDESIGWYERYGLTMLFISHDLAVVNNICDRVAVLYLGKLCELAPADKLYKDPRHPYTTALINSIPERHVRGGERTGGLKGELPSPLNPPSGCRFRTRCWKAQAKCASEEPELIDRGTGHPVACFFPAPRTDDMSIAPA